METTKQGVNYKAVEQWLDQLEPFIDERYFEIYNYSPLDDCFLKNLSRKHEYNALLNMLQACYENDQIGSEDE